MGLSNAAKRARTYDLIINQNQGGGSKKAGFPYIIGRDWHSSMYIDNQTLPYMQRELYTFKLSIPRGVGTDPRIHMR